MSSDEFVDHEPCPQCRANGHDNSGDNLGRYEDGHGHCFACGYHEKGEGEPTQGRVKVPSDLLDMGEYIGLDSRRLTASTCEHFGYHCRDFKGKPAQVANYFDADGKLVGQKVRTPGKRFSWFGDQHEALPFGATKFPRTGLKVVVTEGELDAMSVSQAQQNKYPVVSIQCGAGGQIRKYMAEHREYFNGFDEVVLMFDMDEPGRRAAEIAAAVIGHKARIATLPGQYKDASDMLVDGNTKGIIDAIWRAEEYKPEGIVAMGDILDAAFEPAERGLSWPFESLTDLTYGIRMGEVYAIGAGTGTGKTDFFTQTVAHLVEEHKQKVGYFALEQMPKETAVRIAGKMVRRPLHIPDVEPASETDRKRIKEVTAGKVFLYDSFGANEWASVKDKMEYLVHAEGVKYFFLDHLTAFVAMETDERKALDSIMAEIGAFVKKHEATIFLISHLNTPQGTPHEEGGRVYVRHFRGSRSIGFWCSFIIGLERNQQAEDKEERKVTTVRVLKDRFTGRATGEIFHWTYDCDSGMLAECSPWDPDAADYGFTSQEEGVAYADLG